MTDRELEDAIRAGLRAAAPREVPSALAASAEAIPRSSRRPARRPWQLRIAGGLAAAAAAVVVLALAAAILPPGTGPSASGPSDSGGASASSPASSAATAPPEASSGPSPSASTSGRFPWVPVDMAQLGGVSLDAVTTMADGRLLGIGRPFLTAPNAGPGQSSTMWVSPDGLAWARLPGGSPLIASAPGWAAVVLDVARVGSGYVAVGMDQEGDASAANASAWYSADGATWRRAAVADGAGRTMSQVVVTKDGLVALGEAGYTFHAGFGAGTAIWTSPDGRAWTRVPAGAGPPPGTRLGGVIAVQGGYLATAAFEAALGEAGSPQPPVTAGIWRSADAVHWAPVDGSPLGVAALASRAGLVAVGSGQADRSQPALAWWSADGSTWAGRPLPPPPGVPAGVEVGALTVADTPDGMLAIGQRTDDFTMVAWSSPDGKAWSTPDLPVPGGMVFDRAFAVAGSVLVVGEAQPVSGSVPAMWLVTTVLRFHAPVLPSGSPGPGVNGSGDVACPGTSPCGP